MPAAQPQTDPPATEVNPLQSIARLKVLVEVLRREALTAKGKNRAKLIRKELGRLETELPADELAARLNVSPAGVPPRGAAATSSRRR